MNKKIFNPENYDMVICPCCNGKGYTQTPKRQCCPKCGGFGYIKKEAKDNKNISTSDSLNAKYDLGEE